MGMANSYCPNAHFCLAILYFTRSVVTFTEAGGGRICGNCKHKDDVGQSETDTTTPREQDEMSSTRTTYPQAAVRRRREYGVVASKDCQPNQKIAHVM
jgi:hypothetical protein